MNDGSKDNSGIICDRYAGVDSRILVIHQQNKGVSAARNKGIDLAKGSYISFVDPDDTLESQMYAEMYQNAVKHGSDIVVCPIATHNLIQNTKSISSIWQHSSGVLDHGMIKEKIIPSVLSNKTFSLVSSVNKLYKSSLFKEDLSIRFQEGLHHSEDARLNFNLITKIKTLSYVREPLYNYYIRKRNSLTQVFREDLYDYIKGNKSLLLEISNQYQMGIYNQTIKNHFTGVTLSYINSVVTSGLLKDRKYKLLSKILHDAGFQEDIQTYNAQSMYYRLLKVICRQKNEKILYKIAWAKNKIVNR